MSFEGVVWACGIQIVSWKSLQSHPLKAESARSICQWSAKSPEDRESCDIVTVQKESVKTKLIKHRLNLIKNLSASRKPSTSQITLQVWKKEQNSIHPRKLIFQFPERAQRELTAVQNLLYPLLPSCQGSISWSLLVWAGLRGFNPHLTKCALFLSMKWSCIPVSLNKK